MNRLLLVAALVVPMAACSSSGDTPPSNDITTDIIQTDGGDDDTTDAGDTSDGGDAGADTNAFTTCESDEDCDSGYCIETAEGKVCSRLCGDGCPAGFVCQLVESRGESAFICVQSVAACRPCEDSTDCPTPGDVCLPLDDGTFCGRDCSAGNVHGFAEGECDEGFTCADVGDGVRQCVPTSGSCSCLPEDAGDARSCFDANSDGICYGKETCDPAVGWVECDAPTPAAEICNGVDDDCNAAVDDVPDRGDVCSIDNEFGSCTGLLDCVADDPGDDLACVGPTPAAESCNYLDDDCDGSTDEDFPKLYQPCSVGLGLCHRIGTFRCTEDGSGVACSVTPGEESTEVCNGLDDDCDGQIDEENQWADKGQVCDTGSGACVAFGNMACDPANPSGVTVCNAVAGDGTPEKCDGIDNDCDGGTDEASDLATPPCKLQAGVCADSEQVCAGSLGFQECSGTEYGEDYEPTELSCDGLDNDCDGETDEALPAQPCANQVGVCAGSTQPCQGVDGFGACSAADYGAYYQADEATCDYLDNDCDGSTDEAFRVAGKYIDQQHCGVCGNSCDNAVVHGSSVCDATTDPPSCVVDECDAGYVNVDGLQCIPSSLGLCEPCVNSDTCALPGSMCAGLSDGDYCLTPCVNQDTCPSGFTCTDMGAGDLYCRPDTSACACDGSNTDLQRVCAVEYGGTPDPYKCYGLQQCETSGWSQCTLPGESCNLLDDDCDGSIDEDFVDEYGRYSSDEHCGACGNNCTLLQFDGAAGTCNTLSDPPICSVTCTANCFDVNVNPNDGCECCDPTPTDLPDQNGEDANCDGIDGEVDNGVFVAKDGDDANPGTRLAPKLTIQAGIEAASANGLRDVYVATGVYAEQVSLVADVGVYGGYSSDFRAHNALLYEVAILGPKPDALPGSVNCIGVQDGEPGSTVFAGFSVYGHAEKETGEPSYAVYVRNCDNTLLLDYNRIHGGRGGKGIRGSDGADGSDGAPGEPGVDALDLLATYGVAEHECTSLHHSPGGNGGSGFCGTTITDGGAGGNRTCPTYDGAVTGLPKASEYGVEGANGGAPGGDAGRDTFHQAYQCLGYATFGLVEGQEGDDGSHGTNGTAGEGCSSPEGMVVDGLWQSISGTDGESGDAGAGGGGGGSGAGAWVHTSCFSKDFGYDNLGGSGGGGGSGACGGTAGSAGSGGGGAFGLFVTFDTVPDAGDVPAITGNQFWGGDGGDGGDGGHAGVGGAGGPGALGGLPGGNFEPPDPTYPSFKGGKGGNGGNGGNGGGGGAGCGGPVFGIYAWGTGTVDVSTWKSANTFVSSGSGGLGGVGGFSLGNPGGNGSPGSAVDTNF